MVYLLGGYIWLFIHRPFEIWSFLGSLQIERVYMVLMLFCWLVSSGKSLSINRINLAMFLFSAAILVTWVLSPFAEKPGPLTTVENYFKVIVFATMVVTTVRDESKLRTLFLMFLVAVGVYMAHSLAEYLLGRYQWRMGTRRMVGVDFSYGDPNAFASTMLYTLPFLIPFWNEKPASISKKYLILYALMVVLCILLTGSRAGFAGLCLLSFLILFGSFKNKFQAVMVIGLIGLVSAVVLSAALPEDLQNRYMTILDPSRGPTNAQTSAEGRVAGLVEGIATWQKSPLVGYGPSSFTYATGRDLQPHNLYGQILSEMGVLGSVSLLFLLGAVFLNQRELAGSRNSEWEKVDFLYQANRAISINFFLLLVMGCAGHNLYRYNWIWFAAFGSVVLNCLRDRKAIADLDADREWAQMDQVRLAYD